MAPSTASCITSPRRFLPNIFFSSAFGALPLRKPFIWKSARTASIFSSIFEASSAAGSVIAYSRFRPSDSFSVTCICLTRRVVSSHGGGSGSLVRAEGLEPPRLAAREPKSRVSTSFTTPARGRRTKLATDPPAEKPAPLYQRGFGGARGKCRVFRAGELAPQHRRRPKHPLSLKSGIQYGLCRETEHRITFVGRRDRPLFVRS